jgi:hypothetical protein
MTTLNMLIDKKNKPAILFPQMHKQVLFKHKVSKIRNKATPSLFLPKILTFFLCLRIKNP